MSHRHHYSKMIEMFLGFYGTLTERADEADKNILRPLTVEHSQYLAEDKTRYFRVTFPLAISAGDDLPEIENCIFHLSTILIPAPKGVTSISVEDAIKMIEMVHFALTHNNPLDLQFCIVNAHVRKSGYFKLSGDYTTLESSLQASDVIPPKRTLVKFCNQLHRFFCSRLFQLSMPEEEKYIIPHMGWATVQEFPQYEGINSQQRELPPNVWRQFPRIQEYPLPKSEEEDFGAQIPGFILVPLIAYLSFSILKPFFKGYPRRISPQQPYQQVIRSLNKVIALSISGPFALDYARLICGIFMEYGDRFRPVHYKKVRSPESRRIHDGVVIYGKDPGGMPKRMTHQQRNQYLLQDASVLFVDHICEDDPRVLHLVIPPGTPPPPKRYSQGWMNLIRVLISDLDRTILDDRPLQKIQQKNKRLLSEYKKDIQPGKPVHFITKEMLLEGESPLLDYDRALNDLKGKRGVDPQKAKIAAYLLASCKVFLNYSPPSHPFSRQLRFLQENVCDVLADMCQYKKEKHTLLGSFGHYISYCFAEKKVLAVREEGKSGSECLGWYDSKKSRLYLPYDSYFESFQRFCSEIGESLLPQKHAFQQDVLLASNIIRAQKNGNNGRYLRCACQVVVAPLSQEYQGKSTVLVVDLLQMDAFRLLTPSAQRQRALLDQKKIPRRKSGRKETAQHEK